MFRKEEAAVEDWSEETVAMCARRQADILDSGALLVRPGGRLVYSTCTFAPAENEETVAAFLERHPEFEPEAVSAPWFTAGSTGNYRMWPHKLLGEGHFAAVLKRKEGADGEFKEETGEKAPALWNAFAKELGILLPEGKFLTFGQSLYRTPTELPQLRGLKVLRPGLELGIVKKDRFEPAHALALWLDECTRRVDLAPDSEELNAYLHGDVIPCSHKGWCLVTTGEFSLGWGKGDGAQLKNHYPKGLRRLG